MSPAPYIGAAVLLLLVSGAVSAQGSAMTERDLCLLRALSTASSDTTVAEIRRVCAEKHDAGNGNVPGLVEERLRAEAEVEGSPWAITPHKPSYLMPFSINSRSNAASFSPGSSESRSFKDTELKFQISLKFPLIRSIHRERDNLYFAYTNQSWWQFYADDQPFRETNHEPEIFLRFRNDREVLGLRNRIVDLGIVHESNGRSAPLSRAWNRLYAQAIFERGNFALGIKPWLIIESSENPDIDEFLGHGEVRAAYAWKRNSFSAMVRNNLDIDNNKGALELTWSRRLSGVLRLYAQLYSGYGESLLDYNRKVNRFGIGISINDYLLRSPAKGTEPRPLQN